MRSALKRSWLPLFGEVEEVKDYNWCKFMLEDMILAIKITQTDGKSSISRCIILLTRLGLHATLKTGYDNEYYHDTDTFPVEVVNWYTQ
ncbi:hypothetical protein M9H77_31686 [Catharanthus roseus]|uniref:Uncharacterized protein n=1 Tax=Catharanthus roseus TaxID=4058 RepID=A0ACC0A1P1_CATRO|nr:hypothetical protein M9H77_31686 [Catharanthus roseus]